MDRGIERISKLSYCIFLVNRRVTLRQRNHSTGDAETPPGADGGPAKLDSRFRGNDRKLRECDYICSGLAVRELRTRVREKLRTCRNAHPLRDRVVVGICYPDITVHVYRYTPGIVPHGKRRKQCA